MDVPQPQDAARSAQEFIKYIVVLAVGALGFSLTTLASTPKSSQAPGILLLCALGALALSVFLGILAYGTLISQLYYGKVNLEARPLNWQSRGQWFLFFGGIVALGAAIVLREMARAPGGHAPLLPL